MTREELKTHCEKTIEHCEMWARHNGEEPGGKVYEEHKLILELLEQEPVLDRIRAEIKALPRELPTDTRNMVRRTRVLDIIDKYTEGVRDKE